MSLEGDQRRFVVREARSWIGTPYHPQADIKGAGVDCGMLLVRVFVDTGLCAPFDPRPYADDWYLHRSEERYLGFIFDRTKEVASPLPGDVMVFRYGRCYAHGGVVTEASPLTIVHAFQPARWSSSRRKWRAARLSAPWRGIPNSSPRGLARNDYDHN
jgi:cell wall-associated NlpC family hydrolase